jgi:hypothetical protein
MQETHIHPLDFTALQKGQFINHSDVEAITAVRFEKDPRRYQLELMKLRQSIWDNRDDLVAKIEGLGLRILTDEEADQYIWDEQRRLVDKQKRLAKARARIDRTHFDTVATQVAEQRDMFCAGTALMLNQAIRKAERDQLLLGEATPGRGPNERNEQASEP